MSIGTSYTRSKFACAAAAVMLMVTQALFAQGSGTLIGRILDKETGEALVGANVIVTNTNLGAAADIDGKFTIHNIPTGKGNVKSLLCRIQTNYRRRINHRKCDSSTGDSVSGRISHRRDGRGHGASERPVVVNQSAAGGHIDRQRCVC